MSVWFIMEELKLFPKKFKKKEPKKCENIILLSQCYLLCPSVVMMIDDTKYTKYQQLLPYLYTYLKLNCQYRLYPAQCP